MENRIADSQSEADTGIPMRASGFVCCFPLAT
jgi:hypothetical protein